MTLSESTRAAIEKLVATYPQPRTALLPALKLAQADVGWLSPAAIAEAADVVGVPHSAAYELAAFYTMLHTRPVAATQMVVCAQLPCALRGADQLVRDLEAGLEAQIAAGTVEVERTSECFGACHRAPMARVNGEYRENLDATRRQQLMDELRSSGTNGRAH
ncbi:MAG: NAD(P)H-dependent oxidoreductase subunit E [Chloroflexi bacterium]|nr:NAD(P)H-dependent oxidoreductase subunit E [Chloroflexota bacterium]MBV9543907.1 NAD(P)H-dependent oxidoreductase subunit E [Chloroflexota bacterium]